MNDFSAQIKINQNYIAEEKKKNKVHRLKRHTEVKEKYTKGAFMNDVTQI